jgi:hypothetical protein
MCTNTTRHVHPLRTARAGHRWGRKAARVSGELTVAKGGPSRLTRNRPRGEDMEHTPERGLWSRIY